MVKQVAKIKEEKIDFDLSNLELKELIEVYERVDEFLKFLDESKIDMEEKGNDEDE